MNKTIIAERFSKAISTYPREANVQRQIADKMIHLLQKHIPSPNTCHPSLRSLSGRQPSSEITTGFSFRTIKSRHGATRQTPSCTSKLPIISRSFLMR